MKLLVSALAMAIALSAAPAQAKKRTKTVVGCVEQRNSQYELAAVSKKGKHHHYALAGVQNFAQQVGHRVRVSGLVGKGTINVSSLQSLSTNCR